MVILQAMHYDQSMLAAPMADTIEEMQEIIELAAKTRLIYMMGETAYYYPAAMFCRAELKKGSFGDFVYGEANYYHDMDHGFYDAYKHSGGVNWKRSAGVPPTHSIGALVSATGAHVDKVSCFGYRDDQLRC
jgi:predicted dehydrogenase